MVTALYAVSHPLMMRLPFKTIRGVGARGLHDGTLPNAGNRAINAAWTSHVGTVNPTFDPTMIFGGLMNTDDYLVETDGSDIKGERIAKQIMHLSHYFAHTVIKGDNFSDGRQPNGLQARCVVGSTQVTDAGTTSGGDALSLTLLDRAIKRVFRPTHLFMSSDMVVLLSAAARQAGVMGNVQWQVGQIGYQLETYRGLPIVEIGGAGQVYDSLPFTEAAPVGGQAQTGSIYIASVGLDGLHGIQNNAPKASDDGRVPGTSYHAVVVNWYAGVSVARPNAIHRIRGIKNVAMVA